MYIYYGKICLDKRQASPLSLTTLVCNYRQCRNVGQAKLKPSIAGLMGRNRGHLG